MHPLPIHLGLTNFYQVLTRLEVAVDASKGYLAWVEYTFGSLFAPSPQPPAGPLSRSETNTEG